jgi:hypothetical protein
MALTIAFVGTLWSLYGEDLYRQKDGLYRGRPEKADRQV